MLFIIFLLLLNKLSYKLINLYLLIIFSIYRLFNAHFNIFVGTDNNNNNSNLHYLLISTICIHIKPVRSSSSSMRKS